MLPKEEREERAVKRFLEHYNQTNGTSYQDIQWLDRTPRTGEEQQVPIPDCICKDPASGAEIVIECTMLTGKEGLKLMEGADRFLAEVASRLECKLPGVFFLHDWDVDEIRYKSNTCEGKITQLCQEILRVAPTLAEGEEAQLCQPFPVRLKKEEVGKVPTKCALIWDPPGDGVSRADCQRLEGVLEETNRKFANYIYMPTVLLMNIWVTGLDYETFEEDLFRRIDMSKYPDINHIYLSEGLPDPTIYHLFRQEEYTKVCAQ